MIQSLYLDRQHEYLASTTVVEGSEESGSRVVIERRHADEIPPELLAEVGDKRVERTTWGPVIRGYCVPRPAGTYEREKVWTQPYVADLLAATRPTTVRIGPDTTAS